MNYKQQKQKIKPLSDILTTIYLYDYIINKFSWSVKKEEFLKAEFRKSFLNFPEEHLSKRINEEKLSFVPIDLKDEVLWYINNQYKGDFTSYFKSVEIYFKTFTLENLSKCNIKESKLYEESSSAGRRKLNRERKHNLWHASVLLKLTGKKRAKYSCNTIFNEFKQSKKKEFEFIANCKIVGEDKKILDLKDCVKTAAQAIAEKINLIKVQEKIAEDKGWTWVFITLTLPGEYHPNPLFGKNSYNGVSPRESAKLLNANIKRVRALLHKWSIKAGIDYIGCSSSECHKDGILHKHMLFFCSKEMLEELRKAFVVHFPNLNDKSFAINDGRAKASSYVFKYVMKSITSYDANINFEEMDKGDKSAVLNNAFRSYNFIRGFSFFGIENCLTKFRFIARNLKDMELPAEIKELVKENNLYELLTKGYFKMFENIYTQDGDNRVFVGCSFNGKEYFKRFFSLVRKAVEDMKLEVKEMYAEMACNRRKSLLNGVVILNHNYSREEQSSSKNKKEKADWLKWLIENPILTQ
jgi:hypothetical protein